MLCKHLRIPDARKQLTAQKLIPKSTLKGLSVTILPQTARLNIQWTYTPVLKPSIDCLGSKLRAIVTSRGNQSGTVHFLGLAGYVYLFLPGLLSGNDKSFYDEDTKKHDVLTNRAYQS